tara:strand:- start:1630 stop:2316 length:687 start_codon:yes stop_codon:yes gene_type:complete
MEVILLEKIHKLGVIGDVVRVKAGYARNFLLPHGKALIANKENKLFFNEKKESIESENLKSKKEAEIFSKKLGKVEIRLIRAASDSGQLYGSVTSRDIVNFLNEKNLQINKNQVILNKSLKNLTYENIQIKLHPEIIVEMPLNVARSEDEANKQTQLKKPITSNDEANVNNKTEKINNNSEIDQNKAEEIQSTETKETDNDTEEAKKLIDEKNKDTMKEDISETKVDE